MHSLGMQQICETAGGGSCSYRGAKGQNTIAGRSHGWMVHLLPSSLIRPPGCRLAVASLTTPSQTSLAELTFSAKCCPSSQRDMEPSLRLWQEHFNDPCQWLDGGLNNMPSVDDMFYTAKDVEIFMEHPLQLNFDRLVSSLHMYAEVPGLEKNSEIAGFDHLNSKALMSIDVYPDGWSKDLFENNGAEGESHGCNGIQGFDGGHAIQDPASLRREDPCLEKEPIWSGLLCKPELESSVEMGALKAQMQNGSGSGSRDMLSLEEVLIVLDQCKSGLTSVEDTILTLQKCRKTKSLAYAKSVHLHICSNGLATHKAVENYIVPMFVECGSVSDAQLVFDRLSCRKEHSWTSLILGYSECGQSLHAFYLYRKMQEDNANPSTYTLAAVLKACTRLKDLEKGQEIHIEIAHEGLENDLSVGSSLIGMYSKCGSLSEALEVFDELSSRDVSSWTALIAGYAEHGPYNEALRLFEQMKLEGVTPGMTTYACSLKACNSFGAVDKGHEVHTELAMKGFERDVFVGSALVCMYAKCGSLAEAQEAFDKLPIRDVVSWNSLIAGYVEYGSGQEALGRLEEMKLEGIFPDAVTYASSLKACSSIGAIDKGREIHMEIALIAMEGDSSVFNSLVGMYAKCGSLLEAQGVFDQVPVQDVASWTALIAGYAEYGPAQEALNCFENMQLEGILPDNVMFACSLKACSVIGAINKGREIHMDIARRGFEREPSVGNTLVSMYAKLGLVLEAQKALDKLPVRNVVLWTALIAGYAEYGPFEEASKCLEQMQLEGVAPNSVTFACVLKACGIIRAVSKGWEIHMEIVLKGFETDLLIGNTLIGMYARCGSLLEAQEVFAKLQVRDAVSWNTLISGFVEHGTGQEVLNIFEKMQVEGDCLDAVTFTYILKACGSLGAIDKGREIHMKIRENEFDRESSVGNSLISMYAKCGSLVEAQEVFDKLPVRDVVAWSSMIKAYGINHQGRKAVQYFEDMIEQEVKPDAVTFSCLFLACSHASLVCQGQEYFKVMTEIYGIVPTIEHYTCMIDLLARSGHLYEAENFIMMGCPPLEGTWGSLLSGCKTYGEEELGFRCFQQLVQMNSEVAAWYVLMADIYASAGRWDDVKRVEELRKHAGANKKPASALIEVNKRVHEFVVGNNGNEEVLEMLYSMSLRMKEEGHLPNLDLILKSSTDVRKEAALCEHAERLALAFGLLNTNQGATLRVTKNLRMCNDCHNTSKILSKVERREIILRDDCCIHHFKNGLCSCGDIF